LGRLAGIEVPIPKIKKNFYIKDRGRCDEMDKHMRHVTYSALPYLFNGAILYTYDTRNVNNTLIAAVSRVGQHTDAPNMSAVEELYVFNTKFMEKFIPKAQRLPTLKEVMDSHQSFSLPRKEQILSANERMASCDPSVWIRARESETFIKREFYKKPSRPRLINPATDEYKSEFFVVIKCIDDVLYIATKFWNVKGLSSNDRPKMIEKLFGDDELLSTDFTAFEGSINYLIMNALELALLKHVCGHLLDDTLLAYLLSTLSCTQILRTNAYIIFVEALRKSGEISTSTFNFYVNLVVTLFSYYKEKYFDKSIDEFLEVILEEIKLSVEGDDGLHNSQRGLIEGTTYKELGF